MIENDRPMPARPQPGKADDRIRLNHWTPPQHGIAPHEFYGYRMPI